MADPQFYRRPLPIGLVPFASPEGRALFREALEAGQLEGWFTLSEQFQTQSDPSFCGLGTLVVALNSLGIDPGRVWKGPWRWYSEELLDCCLPLDAVRARGVTLGQFACLARCNGATATVRRADSATVDELRRDLEEASAAAEGIVVAASYSRRALGQTGDGHFSPVAGLHAGRDLALVLDVARFKYPPHWTPVTALFDAMRSIDPVTGHARGWVVLRRRTSPGATLLSRLGAAGAPSLERARDEIVGAARALSSRPSGSITELFTVLAESVGASAEELMAELPSALEGLDASTRAALEELLAALESSPAHAAASAAMPALARVTLGLVALLTLALPEQTLSSTARDARAGWLDALPPALSAEVAALKDQLASLVEAARSDVEPAPCAAGRDILPSDERR